MKNVELGAWISGLAGRASGLSGRRERARDVHHGAKMEQLETRVLLSALDDFPNSTLITLAAGQATESGSLGVGEDTLFRVTLTERTWITFQAQATGGGLDTRIELYRDSPLVPGTPMPVTNAANQNLFASNDGTLTGAGLIRDAWVGSVLNAGTYFILVIAENNTSGDYDLNLSTLTTAGPALDPLTGSGVVNGFFNPANPTRDIIFEIDIPDGDAFDDLLTVYAGLDLLGFTIPDLRVEIFNPNGVRVAADSLSGNLNDAFAFARSKPQDTFYVRIRSDDPNGPGATGDYEIRFESSSQRATFNEVNRIYTDFGVEVGFNQIAVYSFSPLTSGLTYITAAFSPAAFVDSAVRLIDDNGNTIAFSDNFSGFNPYIRAFLDVNQRYFLIFDSFPTLVTGLINVQIESAATEDPGLGTDDHINFFPDNPEFSFRNATPIRFGEAQPRMAGPGGSAELFDVSWIQIGTATGRIEQAGDTDVFVFVPPIDMLGTFEGWIEVTEPALVPERYDFSTRPASSAEILVQDVAGVGQFAPGAVVPSFVNTNIQIYDSNGDLIYENGQVLTGGGNGVNPSGALDRSRWPRFLGPIPQYAGTGTAYNPDHELKLWGGEAYYLVVGAQNVGRYSVQIAVDGVPDPADPFNYIDPPFSEVFPFLLDPTGISTFAAGANGGFPPTIAQFATASNISGGPPSFDFTEDFPPDGILNTFGGLERAWIGIGGVNFAEVTNFPNPDFPFGLPASLDTQPIANAVASGGLVILHERSTSGIIHPNDTDLYSFRAPFTGTVEIRIQTTNLDTVFQEIIVDDRDFATWDGEGDRPDATITTNVLEKTYNSLFDSALRVYNNDFEQIGYNDYNPVMRGETETVGAFGGITSGVTFQRRDARLVLNVEQGETYFIQVEAALRDAWLANQTDPTIPVSWQHLIGSYRLHVVNVSQPSGSSLTTPDDFPDADDGFSIGGSVTGNPVPIAVDLTNGGTGNGFINGNIRAIPGNPFDTDIFSYTAPAAGPVTITVTPRDNDTLLPVAVIYDATGVQLAEADPIGGDRANGVSITLFAEKGEKFLIVVAGGFNVTETTEGDYTVNIDGPSFIDDAPDRGRWHLAETIEFNDTLGTGTLLGDLEGTGDSDVYRFVPLSTGPITITVTDLDAGADAQLTVYETSIAPDGTVVLRRVADTRDVLSPDPDSRSVIVNLMPGEDRVFNGNTYRDYYILIEGLSPQVSQGAYRVDFTFAPTDDHADEGEFEIATRIELDPNSGNGTDSGVIEIAGDSDLFVFTPSAQGPGQIVVVGQDGFNPRVRVFLFGEDTPILTANPGSPFAIISDEFAQGVDYYILVDAGAGSTATGPYGISVQTTGIDDHANEGAFDFATELLLNNITGNAFIGSNTPGTPGNPQIDYAGDTDLFTFVAIESGSFLISVTPIGAPTYAPNLTIYNEDRNIIGTTSAGAGSVVTFLTGDFSVGDRLYVLVGGAGTGEYRLFVDGPPPGQPGGPGDPGSVDFDNPEEPPVNTRTGDARANGSIDVPGARILYEFAVPDAAGRTRLTDVFIKVFRADGSELNASVSVYNAPSELPANLVAFDDGGVPGSTASLEFQAPAGQILYVIVAGVGASTGDFEIVFNAEPETFSLYYPEGFAGAAIREFVSIANPNNYEVTYSVRVAYEGDLAGATVVSNVTIAPGARGGITLSDGAGNFLPGITPDTPYAIILESDGPLAGTLARYDFDSAVGDALTDVTSDTWTFARVERQPGSVFDFLVYYNPNPFEVDVTLTVALADGTFFTDTRTVAGDRRGGWNINETTGFPVGIFGATITATPTDAANDPAFDGIVASLTHYNQAQGAGYAVLGDALGGSTTGAITRLLNSLSVTAEIVLHNPGSTAATVNLVGTYTQAPSLPDYFRTVNIPAGQTVVLRGANIGIVNNQPVGITYTSNVPVTVLASENQLGEANANAGLNVANERWYFGDAFINSLLAGENYFETLAFHNPTNTNTIVTVELLFTNSDVETITINLDAGGFADLLLHQAAEILSRVDPLSFFSIVVSAPVPIVATLTHYDLFLQGGWGIAGSNIGIPTPFTLL